MTIEQVKQIADDLGITYNNAIGVNTLIKRVEEHCIQNGIDNPFPTEEVPTEEMSEEVAEIVAKVKGKKITDIKVPKVLSKQDADKLVRVIITCNNPDKVQYDSDIFYVGNSKYHLGKCVQFNIETHVPQMILSFIEEKMYTQYIYKKVDGKDVTEARQAKEYTIERLDALSAEELERIRTKQLADNRKTIDD